MATRFLSTTAVAALLAGATALSIVATGAAAQTAVPPTLPADAGRSVTPSYTPQTQAVPPLRGAAPETPTGNVVSPRPGVPTQAGSAAPGVPAAKAPDGTAAAGAMVPQPIMPMTAQGDVPADQRDLYQPLPANSRIMRGGDPVGWPVVDAGGNTFGTVEYVLVNPDNNYVTYALIGANRFGAGNYVAVPVARLQDRNPQVVIDLPAERLDAAPRYRRSDLVQAFGSRGGSGMGGGTPPAQPGGQSALPPADGASDGRLGVMTPSTSPAVADFYAALPSAARLKRQGDPVGKPLVDVANQPVGTIDYILVDPGERNVVYAFVGNASLGPETYMAVPASHLQEQGDAVRVDVPADQLRLAPRYRLSDLESYYGTGVVGLRPVRGRSVAATSSTPDTVAYAIGAAEPEPMVASGNTAAAAPVAGSGASAPAEGVGSTAPAGLVAQPGLGASGEVRQTARLGDYEEPFYQGLRNIRDLTPTGVAVLAAKGELIGRQVIDAGRQPFGRIERLLVNPGSGEIRYAVISSPEIGRGAVITVPVTRLQAVGDQVMVRGATSAHLRQAPAYQMSELQERYGGPAQ